MLAWTNTAWKNATAQTGALPKLDTRTTGLVAGTKVATKTGWTPVETILPGQQVLTFDGGLQTVVAVTRHKLMADTDDMSSWPLFVPAGALGNLESMAILPHQSVMIESDFAEAMTGDPFVLIPATALEGYHGIEHRRPDEWVEVIQLHFDEDQIVFANVGALFLCRAEVDILSDTNGTDYDVMPLALADDLIDSMIEHDEALAPAPITTTTYAA